MRALIQRVSRAEVHVNGTSVGAIDRGLLALVAVVPTDTEQTAERLAHRLVRYRVFPDAQGRMNASVQDVGGRLLLVSQFTLAADTRKGLRPSFAGAAPPDQAQRLFDAVVTAVKALGVPVATGQFGANLQVSLVNDGPVTILLDV